MKLFKGISMAVHVGELIRLEIERRDWTQGDLALIMDRPVKTINQIITGKSGITANTALQLEAALGIEALTWLNLQSLYQLSRRC